MGKLTLLDWMGVTIHSFRHYDRMIHLIDTPGFGSAERSEEEVLEELLYWLLKAYGSGIRVTGVVYMHRIDEPRMTGIQLRVLQMFKKLCGTQNYPAMVMATTGWNRVTRDEGEARVAELVEKDHFWGDLYSGGGHVEPVYDGNRRSALRIINLLLGHTPGRVLEIQRQMVEENLQLYETDAGQILYDSWLSEKQNLERVKADTRNALQGHLDNIYTTQLAEYEQSIQQLNTKLQQRRQKRKEEIITVREIRIKDDFRWINDELNRSLLQLQDLEECFNQLSWSKNQSEEGRLRKELLKELRAMRKRIQYLQRAKANRAETYQVVLVGVKVAATVAAAIVPVLACALM
jgi:hypothetical protein